MEWSSHWPLLALTLIQLAGCTENHIDVMPVSYEPSWRYRCVTDEGCLRSEYPNGVRNTSFLEYDSLDLCRTLCGRFGGIWPKPLSAALSTQTVKIHPNYLRFNLQNAPAETRSLLVEMTHVVTGNLMAECGGNVTELVDTPIVVDIVVTSPSLELSWDTNEQYSLDISSKKGGIAVHISADTVYGARHGLESFTHLVTSDRAPHTSDQTCSLHLVSGAKIKDRPVYKHRGFLLDTSRNFIPMKDIKRMVDAMATTKMNVFHWHVTDSHSFPLESRRVPLLTKYGAYSENEIYNAEQVREFIRYAQIRGVRVVIEIDAPAHAGNGWQWGKDMPGYGDLVVCVNKQPWRDSCIQPPCGQLNPANPVMYKVLKDLYRDVADYLIKPALFHMGGDEVFFPCWESNEEIRNYMRAQGFDVSNLEGFMDLWGEFHKKTLNLWDEVMVENEVEKKQPVLLWSSDLTQANRIRKYLDKERYVIQVWEPENSPLLAQLINLGYKTISIPKDVWYLDHGFWGVTKYGNWRRMYNYNLPKNILGGEVAMWTEYVDNQNLDTRAWPRAAAVAERLWSDPTARAQAAEPRMQRLRSRLAARGLRPDAIAPEWCAQHDGKCL